MLENKNFFKIEESGEKSFGYIFSIFFFLIGVYFLYLHSTFIYWLFVVSLCFLVITLFFPKILKLPNKMWIKFGILLNSIVSPIIMFLIFVITFFPIGFIFKAFNIDLIKKNINKDLDTYWINRKHKMESLRKLF